MFAKLKAKLASDGRAEEQTGAAPANPQSDAARDAWTKLQGLREKMAPYEAQVRQLTDQLDGAASGTPAWVAVSQKRHTYNRLLDGMRADRDALAAKCKGYVPPAAAQSSASHGPAAAAPPAPALAAASAPLAQSAPPAGPRIPVRSAQSSTVPVVGTASPARAAAPPTATGSAAHSMPAPAPPPPAAPAQAVPPAPPLPIAPVPVRVVPPVYAPPAAPAQAVPSAPPLPAAPVSTRAVAAQQPGVPMQAAAQRPVAAPPAALPPAAAPAPAARPGLPAGLADDMLRTRAEAQPQLVPCLRGAPAGVAAASKPAPSEDDFSGCKICMEPLDTHRGFLHSGSVHTGVCAPCCSQVMRAAAPACPICRRPVESVLVIF